jgi:regulator of sigma E protease
MVEPSVDKPLSVVWERNGARDSATVTPRKEMGVGRIDVSYRFDKRRIGLLESLVMGSRQTMLVSREIFNFFPKLLSGRVSSDEVGGPVRIGQLAGETFRWGWSVFLSFIAVMSAQLGLINLLPIPILDGGHILILGVETAIRKPINMRQRIVAQQIGFALLVAVMVGLTFKDIVRVLVK